MVDTSSVLDLVKRKGPVIPRDIVKELGGDTFIIGAILSTLAASNSLKISSGKFGGSPVYYVDGQEPALQSLLYKFFHEKEKKAFDMLKQEKVLKDNDLDPVYRVALRNIKDFAKPIEVSLKDRKELFWKWYLVRPQEAEMLIRKKMGLISPQPQAPVQPQRQDTPIPAAPIPAPAIEPPVMQPQPAQAAPQKIEAAPKVEHTHEEQRPQPQKAVRHKEPESDKEADVEEKKTLKRKDDTGDDKFLRLVEKRFDEKGIEILEKEIVKKGSEIDMIVLVPSAIGKLKFFCKAKDKKKINDKDLSSAVVKGHVKKLSVMFATTGEMSKKTKEILDTDYSDMTVFILK